MKNLVVLLIVTICTSLSCSSIKSVQNDPQAVSSNGLTYFMPSKDLIVTLKISSNKLDTVIIKSSDAYPDLTSSYSLTFHESFIAKNEMDISITKTGLLSSVKSVSDSQMSEIAKSIGSIAGTLFPSFNGNNTEQVNCIDGYFTYRYKFAPSNDTINICRNISVIVKAGWGTEIHDMNSKSKRTNGIYYRQELPYHVIISDSIRTFDAVIFSPSNAPVKFLSVNRSLFAKNNTNFKLVDGVPTGWQQTKDGEIVGLLKLPADIIGSYFSAVGNLFDFRKNNASKEVEVLLQEIKLDLAKQKYENCLVAIKGNNDELINSLGCDK